MSRKEDPSMQLEKRPGIFIVGSPNVGKRTILSRLLSLELEDDSDTSSEILVHGWTINTKYYTADVSVWMAHLHDGFSIGMLPGLNQLAALVMVFDMSDLASLAALKDWVSHTDIHKFDILLCIGNKADLVQGNIAHVEYRRRIHRLPDSDDPYVDVTKYGLVEDERDSLLGYEEPSCGIKKSCLEWCNEHQIEYIEVCASNADFDKCLSADGDIQGVERIYGALSAHMWPGMILKSGDKIMEPTFTGNQELSEEESDYEIEYEVLSAGSAEPWEGDEGWQSASSPIATAVGESSAFQTCVSEELDHDNAKNIPEENLQASQSVVPLIKASEKTGAPEENITADIQYEDEYFQFEDLDQLMSEIGNMRDSLRLIPDFQRREMAASLAMKMATMFGDGSSGEEEID